MTRGASGKLPVIFCSLANDGFYSMATRRQASKVQAHGYKERMVQTEKLKRKMFDDALQVDP